MKQVSITLITFIFFSILHCVGADFRYLRTKDGLSNGEINSIAQDKSGKMWFATWTGLTSYDGHSFHIFKPEFGNSSSLSDKKTYKIFIDSHDNLWVASVSGISIYRKDDQTFQPVNIAGYSSSNYDVYNIFEIKGKVLILTSVGIFLTYSPENTNSDFNTKKLKLYERNSEITDFISYLNCFNDELVLISNAYLNDPTHIFLTELIISEKDTLLSVKNRIPYRQQINSVEYVKDENKLYLGTNDGISILSIPKLNITDQVFFKGMNIQDLLYVSDHKIYCHSNKSALLYADLHSLQTGQYLPDPFKPGSLLDSKIKCLFEDFSGNLWIGQQGLGLSILSLKKNAFYSFKRDPSVAKSLSENMVMCFNGTDKEIIIGLRQEGLNVTPKQLNQNGNSEFEVVRYQQLNKPDSPFDRVWSIARESDSVFWIASNGGLARLSKTNNGWIYGGKNEIPLFEKFIRQVIVDKDQNFWLGGDDGLVFIPAIRKNSTRKSYTFHYDSSNPEGISNQRVISMLIDSKNRFWVGTEDGLNLLKTPYDQLDLSGKEKPDLRFKQFIATSPVRNFLNANEIECIYENSDGKIWLGTQGGGINILDVDAAKFTYLTTENGLPGNDVLGILSDQNEIKWISTNNGIVSFDSSNKTKPFTYFNPSDGLQSEIFLANSYYKSADGEMFFGGENGFTRFYPSQITVNLIPPKIGLTYLKIFDKIVNIGDKISRGNVMLHSLDITDKIELPYKKNSFSIGVGVHHYQYSEGNLIKYMLDGFNDKWMTISASSQYINFSKVPYGSYTLHISAISADNVDAESERIIKIRILPPWYQTWYFRIFLLLILIGLIRYIVYWQTRKQKLAFQKEIDNISVKNNENKMQFLTNIAHELRTPLSLVIAPIEDMQQNYTEIDPTWKNHLNLIFRNSNYLLTLINQIIDFKKLNAGELQFNLQKTDIVSLVRDVVINFKGLESRQKTNLNVKLPENSILVDIDQQKIKEVLYNLLSNAFKHTAENHYIEVLLQVISEKEEAGGDEKGQIRITVFNEGIDISDEDKVKIFDRFYKVNEKVEGAGIGLSFSKSLIEMHNGSITVESVNGVGVAFHVILPFNKIEITEPVANQNLPNILWNGDFYNSEEIDMLEIRGKDLTIVIVEDNIDLRTFLRNTLSVHYNCHEAGDGKKGYELITRLLPDIVISDVIMPKMNGYELCEKIKENIKTCHIPIILLTANNASEHVVSGYQKGADAYVTKPFDMNVIKAQISRLIKNRELIRQKYMTQNFMVEVSPSIFSKDDEFIIKLRQLLEDNLADAGFNVTKLSSDLNMNTIHLYRKLKALTGLSPIEFIKAYKLQRACEMLSKTTCSLKEIGYGVGFNNLSYFAKCFREQFGVTPHDFRKNGLPNPTPKSTN